MLNPLEKGMGVLPMPANLLSVAKAFSIKTDPSIRKINFASHFTSPNDQGPWGICVGEAVAAVMEAYNSILFNKPSVKLSPRWCYDKAKTLDGIPTIEGTYSYYGLMGVQKYSVALEKDFPYSISSFKNGEQIPSDTRITDEYRIDSFSIGRGLDNLKSALITYGPVILTTEIWKGFDYPSYGVVDNLTSDYSSYRGLHCIPVAGFDDDSQLIIFKNSWGPYYGINGWGYMTYNYFNSHAQEFGSIVPNVSLKKLGDLNGDSYVDVIDAQRLTRIVTGLDSIDKRVVSFEDITKDGKVNIQDVVKLLKNIVG